MPSISSKRLTIESAFVGERSDATRVQIELFTRSRFMKTFAIVLTLLFCGALAERTTAQSASTIPNPQITTFEFTSGDTTKDPNLNLHVEIDHPDRVHFYRIGEITCPESVSDRPEDRMKAFGWQQFAQGQSFTFRLDTNIP